VAVEGGVVGLDFELAALERGAYVVDGMTLVFENLGVAVSTERQGSHECNADEANVEHKGYGTAPEGGEFDAVELEEPGGLVCREGSHAESVTAVLLF
jgi:hypothetical protein